MCFLFFTLCRIVNVLSIKVTSALLDEESPNKRKFVEYVLMHAYMHEYEDGTYISSHTIKKYAGMRFDPHSSVSDRVSGVVAAGPPADPFPVRGGREWVLRHDVEGAAVGHVRRGGPSVCSGWMLMPNLDGWFLFLQDKCKRYFLWFKCNSALFTLF